MLEFQNRPEIFIMRGLNGPGWKPQGLIFRLFILILSAPSLGKHPRGPGSRDYENQGFEKVATFSNNFSNHFFKTMIFIIWASWAPGILTQGRGRQNEYEGPEYQALGFPPGPVQTMHYKTRSEILMSFPRGFLVITRAPGHPRGWKFNPGRNFSSRIGWKGPRGTVRPKTSPKNQKT